MTALWLLVLTAVGISAEPAQVDGEAAECCECLTPRGSASGIFQCGDCCGCCDDLRVYRSEILGRLWVRGEYLAWSMKGQYFPSLVTTTLPTTTAANTGVPYQPGAMTLVGDEKWLGDMRSGGRLTGGFWWTPEQYGGIEGSFFEVDAGSHPGQSGTANMALARPYRDATTGQWASLLVAYPGLQSGAVQVSADTQFSGGEALLRQVVRFGESYRLDLVAGYRHAHLGDGLLVTQWSAPTDTGIVTDLYDQFRTENDFHGGQAGLIARWRRNNLSLELLGKVALGESISQVDIDGSPGALLATPSNAGHYRDSGFSTFEELGLNLGVQLTCTSRVFFGYSFLYWSRVARVADQVNLEVNTPLDLKTTSFWAQGLNVGFEYQF
jgi:hypothetical protein